MNHQSYRTSLIGFSALGKQVFAAECDSITVEVVRLEESSPEFLLRQLVRHKLGVTLLD